MQRHIGHELTFIVHFHCLPVNAHGIAGIRETGHEQVGVAHCHALRRQLQNEFGTGSHGDSRYIVIVCVDQDLQVGVAHKTLCVSQTQQPGIWPGLQVQSRLELPACIHLEWLPVELDMIAAIRPGDHSIGMVIAWQPIVAIEQAQVLQ